MERKSKPTQQDPSTDVAGAAKMLGEGEGEGVARLPSNDERSHDTSLGPEDADQKIVQILSVLKDSPHVQSEGISKETRDDLLAATALQLALYNEDDMAPEPKSSDSSTQTDEEGDKKCLLEKTQNLILPRFLPLNLKLIFRERKER